MKIAVAFGPWSEFHAFSRFNCSFLKDLKTKYDKVVAVVPYTVACIVTYADEVLCASSEFLTKVGAQYPKVLNQNARDTFGWLDSGFLKIAIDYANGHYPECDFYLFHEGSNAFMDKGIVDALPKNCKIFNQDTEPTYKNDCWNQWIYEAKEVAKSINDGVSICPFEKDKEPIYKKYGNMFKNDTFMMLTRGFSWKSTMHNTRKDDVIPYIKILLEHGCNLINVGFPGIQTGIQHENYFEVSDDLSYSEFTCLTYMSKGLFLLGGMAAPNVHMMIKTPEIFYTDVIGMYQPIFDSRINKNIYTKKCNLYILEGGLTPQTDFLKFVDECRAIEYEKKYISDEKYIMIAQ